MPVTTPRAKLTLLLRLDLCNTKRSKIPLKGTKNNLKAGFHTKQTIDATAPFFLCHLTGQTSAVIFPRGTTTRLFTNRPIKQQNILRV
jgi:hypothetical protein